MSLSYRPEYRLSDKKSIRRKDGVPIFLIDAFNLLKLKSKVDRDWPNRQTQDCVLRMVHGCFAGRVGIPDLLKGEDIWALITVFFHSLQVPLFQGKEKQVLKCMSGTGSDETDSSVKQSTVTDIFCKSLSFEHAHTLNYTLEQLKNLVDRLPDADVNQLLRELSIGICQLRQPYLYSVPPVLSEKDRKRVAQVAAALRLIYDDRKDLHECTQTVMNKTLSDAERKQKVHRMEMLRKRIEREKEKERKKEQARIDRLIAAGKPIPKPTKRSARVQAKMEQENNNGSDPNVFDTSYMLSLMETS